MNAFVYVIFGALLAFFLIALLMHPRWIKHNTGGFRPDFRPYAHHGTSPNRPGILY